MGKPKPKWVALSLAQDFVSESFSPLSNVIATHVSINCNLSDEEAADFAESNLAEVLRHLEDHCTMLEEDGIVAPYQIDGDATEAYIRWIPSEAKGFRAAMAAMDPREFEDLCKRVLVALGAKEGARTGQTADGGVDFVARDLQIVVPASAGARIHIVGQAKRYALHLPVGEREIREFVGGAIKRLRDPADSEVYRRECLAPVIFAFWTTSEFTSSALAYSRAVGIWYLNGLGLAQLALKNGVVIGISDTSGEALLVE